MHISHPGSACSESTPSKLVFVVFDVFGGRSFVLTYLQCLELIYHLLTW